VHLGVDFSFCVTSAYDAFRKENLYSFGHMAL